MAFKVLFIAHAPDADKEKHRSVITTGMYQLFSVVVMNQAEAIEVCRDFVEKEKIDARYCSVRDSLTTMSPRS